MNIEQMKNEGVPGDEIVDVVLARLNDGLQYAQPGGAVSIDVEDLRLVMNYVKVMETFVNLIEKQSRIDP